MTRDETIAAIAVMQAYVDGKIVQCKNSITKSWFDLTADQLSETFPMWNWLYAEYRIKPEPRVMFATHYEREGNPFGGIYPTKRDAEEMLNPGGVVLQFIEVIP